MQPTLVIGGGSSAKVVVSKAEEAIMNDFGRIPECFRTLTIDADYAYQPDILLDREAAKNLLRNPSGYGLEIDQSEAKRLLRSLETSNKGGLLQRPNGRILFYVTAQLVARSIQSNFEAMEEGIKREKERGLPILNKSLILNVANSFGAVGSSIPPDIISIEKYLFPSAYVIHVTCFNLCSAGTELQLSQFQMVKKNALDLLNELIAIKEEKDPTTFYPYFKDGVLHFPSFKVPAALPDLIFDVRPKTNSLKEVLEGMAQLIKDLVLYGVPISLEHIENIIHNLEGNVISVTTDYYQFPVQQIEEWIEERAFREQLSISIKTDASRSVFAEHTLSNLFEEVI